MNILHIIDSGGLYGAEIMLLNLATEQMRQGHQVVIASIGEPGCGETALEKSNKKFIKRFNYIESATRAAGKTLQEISLADMDAYWEEAKIIV